MSLLETFGSFNEKASKSEATVRREEDFKLFQQTIEQIPEGNRYEIDWNNGEVIIYKNGEPLHNIKEFHPIYLKPKHRSIRHHTGMYDWEGYLSKFFDTSQKVSMLSFQKWRIQAYTKELGISPKKLLKVLQACMLKAFIPEDLRDVANKFCREGKGRKWKKSCVQSLSERRDIIRQCLLDGQENIIPFIINADNGQHTPSLFRATIGKSAWKQVLKNSCTRNNLMCTYMNKIRRISFSEAMLLPSTLYKNTGFNYDLDTARVLRDQKLLTKFETHGKIIHTIRDTKNMYSQLGKPLPKQASKWSYDQWVVKHDQCVEEINARKYSKDTFDWCGNLDKDFVSKCGNYTGTLLCSAFDIHSEGTSMHHCVGSYTERCKEKSYMVFSIKDRDGKRFSTLGCYIYKGEVTFSQHYGYCNCSIQDEDAKTFVKDIITIANERYKEVIKECENGQQFIQ